MTWEPISVPGHDTNRICQACAYDPVRDRIYMYGGTPSGRSGTQVSCLDRYDPTRDTWERMADMSLSRTWIKGIYCRGRLYAMGGCAISGRALTACEAYDIADGTWAPIAAMPNGDYAYAAVTWRDSLVFLVGGTGDVSATNNVEVYSPAGDTWLPATPAPETLFQADACIVGDTIIAAGTMSSFRIMKGGINPSNPSEIAWSEGPSLPCSTRFDGPTVALDGRVYFFGGFLAGQVTSRGWVYDPRTGGFDTLPLLPPAVGTGTARCCFGVARDSTGDLYKLAGDDRGNWNSPNNTYLRLRVPFPPDVGAARIVAPEAIVPPGDTVTPSAWVKNFGKQTEGFRVLMRIDTGHTDWQNAYVRPLDSTRVGFSQWVAAQTGSHTAKCSTMLAGDGNDANDACTKVFTVSAVGVEESSSGNAPRVFALDVPSPNPSRDAVMIRYALPQTADISLKLYDAAGKLRAILDQGRKNAGRYSATFDIRDSRFDIPQGVYLIRLNSPNFKRTRKVVIAQ